MKFKQYGAGLEIVWGAIIVSLSTMVFLVVGYHGGIETILIFLGVALVFFLMGIIGRPGLFHDTVYFDEQGVKAVTRKKTIAYSWDEIYTVKTICGRGGRVGWTIVAIDGEEIPVVPFEFGVKMRVRDYMQSKLPHLDIR